MTTRAEKLARRFHETYERLAPSFGYETRKDSAVPWRDVPEKNRKLMIAVCAELAPTTTPELAIEAPLTLSSLADRDSHAQVYSALLELIDAVSGSGEDPEDVARRLVIELDLGIVCARCGFIYLLQETTPRECDRCETELKAAA